MHKSLVLLEQAISLAKAELELVEREDVEGLEASAAQRQKLITQAWEEQDGCNKSALAAALSRLSYLQSKLTKRARARLEEDRESLKQYRSTSKALKGYGGSLRTRRGPRVFHKFS